jgi:CCR4-NOT transcriptional complex subunit CAF120
VNVSRSNSGQRASWSGNSGAVGTTTTTGRQRSYSIASNYSGRERSSSRPTSIVQTYQPHVMDITEDTPAELQPTFTFLNNHGSKLYQEGYFLKLDDQNAQGRANSDRTWHECFAQLVGTVLSLWDAAELDAAGEDGEVLPKFINITDASIKMIESLKMSTDDSQVLQNILSISTAGRNRYLLHFNSHHSLVQWTSAIRLAMYEHSSLQEAYTGALIAGKARALNNINIIMERATVPSEEWVRVRFGAGVPWRRCWCVITPPSVKELGKAQKEMKKRSPYDRSVPVLKGDIKFYDTRFEGRKLKKAKPIATITDAFAAYAIYPQAKALIDASTLIKVEGDITIHSDPPCSNEGFVFIMPEVHPAVSGFETLLKFLFPVWDTFALYGRPGKLVASPLDSRALMFAMPRHKRYGYLEILDVSGLVTTSGCDSWNDREWRKRLKDLTGQRRAVMDEASGVAGGESRSVSRAGSRRSSRASFGMGALPAPPKLRVGFSDANPANRGSRSFSLSTPTPPRLDTDSPSRPSDGPGHGLFKNVMSKHTRNSSDPEVAAKMSPQTAGISTFPALDSPQRGPTPVQSHLRQRVDTNASEGVSSDDERSQPFMPALQPMPKLEAPAPVARPPKFNHDPSSRPLSIMYHSHETRRANNRLSTTTLSQLAKVGRVAINMDSTPDVTATGRMRAQESGIAVHSLPGSS